MNTETKWTEHDHYLWQGGSRSQIDIILSWKLSHYWTWRTQITTHRSVWCRLNPLCVSMEPWDNMWLQILTGVHLSGQDVHRHLVSLWGLESQPILQGHRQHYYQHVSFTLWMQTGITGMTPSIGLDGHVFFLDSLGWGVTASWRFSCTIGPNHCLWMEDRIRLKIWLVCSQTASTPATKDEKKKCRKEKENASVIAADMTLEMH